MIKCVRIPEERIPILIGKNGFTRKKIQRLTETKIRVKDDVTIEGESIAVMEACEIVKAIGRGFSPQIALKLKDEENVFCVISIPNDRKKLKRIRSRLIGTRGNARRNLERLTGTNISVYGKTVSIIGKYDDVNDAREGAERLITGSPHKNVYRFLEIGDHGKKNSRRYGSRAEGDKC